MSNSNFYDDLDLRYPEIAVCIDRIDRTNPGTKNFYIPILTPNLDTSSLKKKEEVVRQNSSMIVNQQAVNIGNVRIQNYIPITIPKELCVFATDSYNITGSLSSLSTNGNISISGRTGSGGSGEGSHSHSTLSGGGTATYDSSSSSFSGTGTLIPLDSTRYIEPGSKWIVVFIGGDINKPQIIGRYTEPTVVTENK